MNCKEMKEYVDDYILGELDPAIEIQLNEHVTECTSCQKEIEEKEKIIMLFKDSPKFEPSSELYKRIRATVTAGKKDKKLFWGIPQSLVYTVAAFFLGIVLMRTVDVLFLHVEEKPRVEIRYEPTPKGAISDTVEFYPAPAKNLAKI